MKFINYLESISGIGIYPLISLLLFVSIFVIAVILTFSTDKETIQEQSNIPLD